MRTALPKKWRGVGGTDLFSTMDDCSTRLTAFERTVQADRFFRVWRGAEFPLLSLDESGLGLLHTQCILFPGLHCRARSHKPDFAITPSWWVNQPTVVRSITRKQRMQPPCARRLREAVVKVGKRPCRARITRERSRSLRFGAGGKNTAQTAAPAGDRAEKPQEDFSTSTVQTGFVPGYPH